MKMKMLFWLILGLFAISENQFAQQFKPELFPQTKGEIKEINSDTLKILALMVEFQPDQYDATEGNGTFGSHYTTESANRTDILDPLPHNEEYFMNHLLFAKNYFAKASKNRLNIEYSIFPVKITLDSTMRNYSPEVGSSDVSRIARMSQQAWQKAANYENDFPYQEYDMFIIFHAGVGRDVSMPGSLGIERDIPSVYLRLNDPILMPDGTSILHTAVLPETESREVQTITGSVLVELTINGLLVGMIGSHLGLPDLFNTETGYSAIGRLGLMDGESMFAYLGAFPPLPSPFEKQLLGWLDVTEIPLADKNISVTTYETANSFFGDTTIVKIPINSKEYFLVENRQRDARQNGAIVTYIKDGITYQKTFEKDSSGYFNNWDLTALEGVITNVDEFDWALPGGGILIWHIDENIIDEKISSNSINNDPKNKGVKVVEADGIDDIGVKFTTVFGDTFVGAGDSTDFWFSENWANYYENEFSANSKPNTNSNSGSNSGISLTNFTTNSNQISFDFEYKPEKVEFVARITSENSSQIQNTVSAQNSEKIGILSANNLQIFDYSGNLLSEFVNFSNGNLIQFYSANENKSIFVGNVGGNLNFVSLDENGTDLQTLTFGDEITSELSAQNESNFIVNFAYSENGTEKVVELDLTNTSFPIVNTSNFQVQKIIPLSDSKILVGTREIEIAGNSYTFTQNILNVFLAETNTNSVKSQFLVVLANDNKIHILEISSNGISPFAEIENSNEISNLSLFPDENRSEIFISFSSDSTLFAYNLVGNLVDNYPIVIPNRISDEYTNSQSSIVSYFDGENLKKLFVSEEGDLYSENSSNPILSVGIENEGNPLISVQTGKLFGIMKSNSNLNIYQIFTEADPSISWSGNSSNSTNSSTLILDEISVSEPNFNKIKAYNWPNPIYDGGITHFRFAFAEDSEVTIKIFDLAGSLVAELNGNSRANFESEIDWNTENVKSDVYFASFSAKGNDSGKEYQRIIKVAVIK